MKFLIDTHTHTLASGHAYSTMNEMIQAAKDKGLKYLGITEHAPKMPGTCHIFYFENLKVVPRQYDDLTLLLGAEANILDTDGTLDLYDNLLNRLDIIIASLHNPCYQNGTAIENTNAYLGAMKNPKVAIIGHPDDGRIPVDYEVLVREAKKHHVALEVNNSSLSPNSFRSNARENAMTYLSLCKEQSVPIIYGSDAHICYDVANFTFAKEVTEAVAFPKELIINYNQNLIDEYILAKR
ncbi:MAG TPA: phosphatase [Lachnospiraceae bacterium]|nr:phosphatase [Lachnospiraceae bacterium]